VTARIVIDAAGWECERQRRWETVKKWREKSGKQLLLISKIVINDDSGGKY